MLFEIMLVASIILTLFLFGLLLYLWYSAKVQKEEAEKDTVEEVKEKVEKKSKKRELYLVLLLSGLSLFASLSIVLFTAASSPNWFQVQSPELINVDDSTTFWAETWLSIISIIISVVTAVIATLISLKQDKLSQEQDALLQFEFESSLTPVFLTDGFKSKFIPKIELKTNGLYKNIYDIDTNNCMPNGGVFILSFSLENNINPSIKYYLEEFEVYQGFYDLDQIRDLTNPLKSKEQHCSESIKHKYQKDGCVLEIQFFIENREKYNNNFNIFLTNMENAIINKEHACYTLYLKTKATSANPKFKNTKCIEFALNLVNEASLTANEKEINEFVIYSMTSLTSSN